MPHPSHHTDALRGTSYRRGKPQSNDIDLVFTHPDDQQVRGLLEKLLAELKKDGMVFRPSPFLGRCCGLSIAN